MKDWQRGAIILGLVAILGLMGGHYGMVEAEQWPYPHEDTLATHPGAYVGEEVLLFGTVTDTNSQADTATIRVESDYGTFSLTVKGFDAGVERGGVVQVLGPLTSERTVDAERIVVVNHSRSAKWYKYGVSIIGAVLVVTAFFRYWEIDTETWCFEVRDNG